MNDYNTYNYIRGLLEKFYNGETSHEEELQLADFFRSAADLPADMEADRKVFAALAEAETFGEAPADLDAKIMAAVDAAVAPRKSPLGRILIGISVAAAVIAVVMLLPLRVYDSGTGSSSDNQLASAKIADSIKNIEIVPDIPPVNVLASLAPQSMPSEDKKIIEKVKAKPVKKSKAKITSGVEPEEEYTLSEEELQALEMACRALGNASQAMAYAYGCVEESNIRMAEAPQLIDRIMQ